MLRVLAEAAQSFFAQPGQNIRTALGSGALEPMCLWQVNAAANRVLHQHIQNYLYGHDMALIQFVQTQFNLERLAAIFVDELMQATPDGTAAFRAFQLELEKSLQAIVAAVGRDVAEIKELLPRLRDDGQLYAALLPALTQLQQELKEHISYEAADIKDHVTGEAERIIEAVKTVRLSGAAPPDLQAALDLLAILPVGPDAPISPIAPLPPSSRLPFTPTPHFVGRKPELRTLAQAMHAREAAAVSQQLVAVAGLGGIGKTQLAVEFAYRYGRYFAGGVFWVNCAEPATIQNEIAQCGGPAGMALAARFDDLPVEEQYQWVQRAWREPVPRLLIFDNCEDEATLAAHRPPTGGCRLLLTSRKTNWDAGLGLRLTPLRTLSRTQSVELLQRLAPHLEPANADAIAAELGDFPLALHLAGCYLKRYAADVTVAAYLQKLRAPNLLQHRSLQGMESKYSPTAHDLSVVRTFAVSFERLHAADAIDALAIMLLGHAACLAPGQPIPHRLLALTLAADERGWLPHDSEERTVYLAAARQRLVDLGLLEVEAAGMVLHRLVAAFVQDAAGSELSRPAVESGMLAEVDRLNSAGYPTPLRAWLPHLLHVTEASLAREDEQAADLCMEVVYHLFQEGRHASALPYAQRALSIREAVLGREHPDTATSLNNLARLYRSIGKYAAALPLYERALGIREVVLGGEHPDTATSLNNLARLYRSMGEYAAARPLYERALRIREAVLGGEHPDTATSLNNLAYLYRSMGEYAKAQPLYERALVIKEAALGGEHPTTATSLNNLAYLYQSMGEYATALPLYERALAICKMMLGGEHPDTATSLHNLAGLYRSMGEYAAARPLYEGALGIREVVLGGDHPLTAQSLHNLAALYQSMGEYVAARSLYEQALGILQKRLGPEHPNTRIVVQNLKRLLSQMDGKAD